MGTEPVFTYDGEPQPRESIFLECLAGDKARSCDFIIRDGEIIKYINGLLDKLNSGERQ